MDCHFLLKKKMKFVTVWSIRLFLFIDTHSSWRKCHCVSIAVVIIQVFRQYLVKLRWNCSLKIWSVKYTLRGGRIFWFPFSFATAHSSLCLCQVSCFLLEWHSTFTIPLNYKYIREEKFLVTLLKRYSFTDIF